MELDQATVGVRIAHMRLSDYAIDPLTGFLPARPPLPKLPEGFTPWERLVPQLSALIRSRQIRAALAALPRLDPEALQGPAEHERALLILTVFANAWVWGGEEPHLRIPPPVAVPVCAVARTLDRPPITHYASMALNNWQLLHAHRQVSADNARMQVQFLGGVDEDWFFMSCLEVELAGAPLLLLLQAGTDAAAQGDDAAVAAILGELASGVARVNQALEYVRRWCDPHTYYLRVRPFLTGWPAPGVVYEGVSEEPRKYVGGSAGQSSLIQAFDAFLGIAHGDTPVGHYLRAIRAYMPVAHRAFVKDMERTSKVRVRAQDGSPALRSAYNGVIDQIDVFRELHGALARDYIAQPSGARLDDVGTGGTAFASFLGGARQATARARL